MDRTNQTPWLAWVQAGLAAGTMVLAVVSFFQAGMNRELQKSVSQNQARLARANTFANLDNGLIQLIAKSAVDNNDAALTALLAQNGVTFRKTAAPAGAATGTAP